MKKTFLAVLAILTLLTGCFKSENTNTISTDGSTSMEKVIGILGEVFTENNKGVNFTYNPTGSGESLRYSDTLLEKTIYIATLLPNQNILRISTNINTIWTMIFELVPTFF